MTKPFEAGDQTPGGRHAGPRAAYEAMVRASLEAQGVPMPETRYPEIAAEAERLAENVRGQAGRLSYSDEPAHFAALLVREKADG
jgi:hypothetical protein